MAGKVGAGDSEYTALRTKLGLSNTLLMNVHVGNRGGSEMLEHFQDLANAGKMSGPTLKAAYGSELNYVRGSQMLPAGAKAGGAAPGAGGGGQFSVTDPRGVTHYFSDQASADRFRQMAGIK